MGKMVEMAKIAEKTASKTKEYKTKYQKTGVQLAATVERQKIVLGMIEMYNLELNKITDHAPTTIEKRDAAMRSFFFRANKFRGKDMERRTSILEEFAVIVKRIGQLDNADMMVVCGHFYPHLTI